MRKIPCALIALAVLGGAACPALVAADAPLEVSVIGQVAKSYKRQKLPDGTFKPEGYAVTNGGVIPGTIRDESVEKVTFPLIAEVVARHLAKQNYFLAEKAADFNLLIVLHWGCTNGWDDTRYGQAVERSGQGVGALNQAGEALKTTQGDYGAIWESGVLNTPTPDRRDVETEGKIKGAIEVAEKGRQRAIDGLESTVTMTNLANRERDSANLENAKVLGYLDAINVRRDVMHSTLSGADRELMADVEEKRYFVVVTAYDFRTVKDKNRKPLWVTRISIRASGNSFDERLAQMVAAATKALGSKSDLSRKYYGNPRVELGEVEYLGVTAAPPSEAKAGSAEPTVK